MANKDIRRIQDDWAGVSASLTEGKTALLNDVDSECHVFKINGKVFFPAIATSWDGTSYTYLNGKFGGLILGQAQNTAVSGNDTALKISIGEEDLLTVDSTSVQCEKATYLNPYLKNSLIVTGGSDATNTVVNIANYSCLKLDCTSDGTDNYYNFDSSYIYSGKLILIINIGEVAAQISEPLDTTFAAGECALCCVDGTNWYKFSGVKL
jgi:hypothetical protein